MKLSEAIRLGAMSTHQIFGTLTNDERTGTCALGAACMAVGILEQVYVAPDFTYMTDRFPILRYCFSDEFIMLSKILTMNDINKLSRQEIADWVEQIENEIEAKANTKEEILVGA